MSNIIENAVIVLAAGSGERFSTVYDMPKQYVSIHGMPILRLALKSILDVSEVDAVVVVIREKDLPFYQKATEGLKLLPYVTGGSTRQESVKKGLEALKHLNPKNVLIHDAARPFVEKKLIRTIIKGLENSAGIVPAIPISDTVKKCNNDTILWTVDRSNLWRSQTPQGFHYDKILSLHEQYKDKNFTDDAAIAEYADMEMKIVYGSEDNIKITTDRDYFIAKKIFESSLYLVEKTLRVGIGYDIHRYAQPEDTAKRPLKLGGIDINFDKQIVAHSDGDCLIHALIDAMLGSIGLGDIGEHFSDKDPANENLSSMDMLKKVKIIFEQHNALLKNIDVNIICEEPNLKKYKPEIRKNIADTLTIHESLVSIKAKTNEKLDAIGQKQAIACQVVVMTEIAVVK